MSDSETKQTDNKTILMLWTSAERGLRGMRRSLAGSLRAEPHGLDVVDIDLPEALSGKAMVSRVAGMVDGRLESALVASLGWGEVESRLAGRTPRVVVVLDPVAAAAVDTWRSKGLIHAPLVGVTCGLRLDPGWAGTAVDRLAVADEVMAEGGLELGLPAECLVPAGVPVCGGFSTPADEWEDYRRHFGLALDKPVVLVVTDGLEDDLTGALFQLSMLGDKATLLFDVDKDDKSADLLRRRAALYEVAARMFGKVDEAGQLWAASSVVVGRPHLYIEQRVVNLRLPFVCLLPRGKAESEVADVYASRGIGRRVDNMATLAAELDLLLQPEAMDEARQGLLGISRGKAVKAVARLVAQVGAEAEAVLEESRKRAEAAERRPEWPAEDEQPKKKGPLEFIGVQTPGAGSVDEPAQASASLADIQAAEAEAGNQVLEHQAEVERWEHRVELAKEKGDEQLLRTASAMVTRQREAMHRALAELARLAEQRQSKEDPEKRKRKLEKSFKQLEVDDALADLKKKLGF
jgi:hypothetical protein